MADDRQPGGASPSDGSERRPPGPRREGPRREGPAGDRRPRTSSDRSAGGQSARPLRQAAGPGGQSRGGPAQGGRTKPASGPAGRDRSPAGGRARGAEPRPAPPPGLARRSDEPPVPAGVDTRALHRATRAELRGLPKELAEIVAAHLVVAGQLIDTDPDLAYAHAEAARRRAARLPIVREAAAETAYAAGRYDVALAEFRALRRMTGSQDYLPVMADCERALGRPQAALKLAKESARYPLERPIRAEMIIVEAGARADLGQHAEGRRLLSRAAQEPPAPGAAHRLAASRLRYAYADCLLLAGEEQAAREWFAAAARLDLDQETDAAVRVDELDGIVIDYDYGDGDGDQGVAGDEADQGDRPAPARPPAGGGS